MKKSEAFKLIQNKSWTYQFLNDEGNAVLLYLGVTENHGFLIIKFEKNGDIEFTTKIGFQPPEFRKWDFDEETNEIIFINDVGQESVRAELPVSYIYGTELIDITSTTGRFIHGLGDDAQVAPKAVIGSEHVMFVSRARLDVKMFKRQSRQGFNVVPITGGENTPKTLDDIYDYLINHPLIQDGIIALGATFEIKLPKNKKLALLTTEESNASQTYFSGSRGMLLELVALATINNNQSLIRGQEIPNATELLSKITKDSFAGRYELV